VKTKEEYTYTTMYDFLLISREEKLKMLSPSEKRMWRIVSRCSIASKGETKHDKKGNVGSKEPSHCDTRSRRTNGEMDM
jgi:hypothetical protein